MGLIGLIILLVLPAILTELGNILLYFDKPVKFGEVKDEKPDD